MNTIHDENKTECPHGNWFSNCDDCSTGYKDYIINKFKYIREKTIDECIACVPEIKDIGYEKEQEKPNLQDEVLADFYETKAEAFFAGCDKTVEKTITNLNQLKNNG